MYQWRYFSSTGFWFTDSRGRSTWEGPKPVEDRSPENVRRCYQFLRNVPYQRSEDLARLEEQERISVAEAIVAESME